MRIAILVLTFVMLVSSVGFLYPDQRLITYILPVLTSIVALRFASSREMILLILSIICAAIIGLSWFTLGEVLQAGLFVPTLPLVLLLVLYMILHRRSLYISILIYALLFVSIAGPNQAKLAMRWYELRKEVRSIADYANDEKDRSGQFPSSLESYRWQGSDNKQFIQYQIVEGHFVVIHWLVQPGISHWFDSESGWGYYPD